MLIPKGISEIINLSLLLVLCAQNAYALVILLLGKIQIDYYESGIYEKPENRFQMMSNFLLTFFVGAGPYLYGKTSHHSWLISKILYFLRFLLLGIGSIVFFTIINHLLQLISY